MKEHYRELKQNGFHPHKSNEQFLMNEKQFVETAIKGEMVDMVVIKDNKFVKRFKGLNIGYSDERK